MELVKKIPKFVFLEKLQASEIWDVVLLLGRYLSNISKNNIKIVSIKTAALPLFKITLEVYIAQVVAVKKEYCIYHSQL